jgi:hypothetical protein
LELRNCLSLWYHLGSNSGPTGSWPPAFMAPPFKALIQGPPPTILVLFIV